MKQTVLLILGMIAIISVIIFGFALNQVRVEQISLASDLESRTRLLAESLKESVEPLYLSNSEEALQSVMDRFTDRQRLLGLAVYDNKGNLVAASAGLPEAAIQGAVLAGKVMDANKEAGLFVETVGGKVYDLAVPLYQENVVVGALLVVQRADYIDVAISEIWTSNFYRFLVQSLVVALTIMIILRFFIFRPVAMMVLSIRAALSGKIDQRLAKANYNFFNPLAREISRITKSLLQARSAASEEARMRLKKIDTPWTAERLQEFIKAYMKDRKIFAVSNTEPYMHKKINGKIQYIIPASGVITAMEPVMRACGGLWLTRGVTEEDKIVVGADNKIQVPPEEPRYILKRIWLTEQENNGFNVGFCSETLWPLCHSVYVRPVFRKDDWLEYRRVNGKFTENILSEIRNVQRPLILVQDYHFALLPQMVKKARPDAQVSIFWHIPWPSADIFNVCPWKKEILEGILGADVIGFHTRQYCNNFMDTVSREIEAVVDMEQFSITRSGHTSYIKRIPISVAFSNGKPVLNNEENRNADYAKRYGIKTKYLGLGVDRLDYIKGIPERFKAIEFFFDRYPHYREQLTFLQISPLSRQQVVQYQIFGKEVVAEMERINLKFATDKWQPIRLVRENLSHEELHFLYRQANFCLITSLHDGMNMVAKEYAAARHDDAGVLILSQFTGASRDMKGAVIVNPYSAEQTAAAMHTAITMPLSEQRRRMVKMREAVKNYNVYRWSAELIKATAGCD